MDNIKSLGRLLLLLIGISIFLCCTPALINAGPLHEAAMDGDLKKAKELIKQAIDINAKDELGIAPLHYALMKGHREVAEFLSDNGADIKQKEDAGGFLPLHYAAEKGYIKIVDLSLKKGVDVNAKSTLGHTALSVALVLRGWGSKLHYTLYSYAWQPWVRLKY
jgi:ankyrin repeat protein